MLKKILIIDDDETFAKNLQAEFLQVDEQVILAFDGEEGLAKVKTDHPDVIILDIILPKILGLSFLEQLRNDDATKYIPVIVVSSFGGTDNEKRAKELGANEFIVKMDITPKMLADTARRYLPTIKVA